MNNRMMKVLKQFIPVGLSFGPLFMVLGPAIQGEGKLSIVALVGAVALTLGLGSLYITVNRNRDVENK